MREDSLIAAQQSIEAILRAHNREALFVPPIRWTQRHLRLLGCGFKDDDETTLLHAIDLLPSLPHSPKTEHDSPKTGAVASQPERTFVTLPPTLVGYARRIATGRCLMSREIALTWVFGHSESPLELQSESLGFYFANRRVDRLFCSVFTMRQSTEGIDTIKSLPYPYLAALDLRSIRARRSSMFDPPYDRRGRQNAPVSRLCSVRLRRVTPKNPKEDPYFVAILIAMAQAQNRASNEQTQSCNNDSRSFKPSLLVADWDDNDYISLYTADISPSFLDRFDYPASRPVLSCTMTIKRAKIQYRPYETFPARVLAVVSGYAGRPMGLRENDITAQEKLENGLGSKGKEKH